VLKNVANERMRTDNFSTLSLKKSCFICGILCDCGLSHKKRYDLIVSPNSDGSIQKKVADLTAQKKIQAKLMPRFLIAPRYAVLGLNHRYHISTHKTHLFLK